jgi:hypothetical protein
MDEQRQDLTMQSLAYLGILFIAFGLGLNLDSYLDSQQYLIVAYLAFLFLGYKYLVLDRFDL